MPSVQLGAGNTKILKTLQSSGGDYFVMCEVFTTNSGRTEVRTTNSAGCEMWAGP